MKHSGHDGLDGRQDGLHEIFFVNLEGGGGAGKRKRIKLRGQLVVQIASLIQIIITQYKYISTGEDLTRFFLRGTTAALYPSSSLSRFQRPCCQGAFLHSESALCAEKEGKTYDPYKIIQLWRARSSCSWVSCTPASTQLPMVILFPISEQRTAFLAVSDPG